MVNLTRQQAEKYRKAMVDGAQSLTDEEALTAPMLYERWQEGKQYVMEQRLYYEGKLWRVLINHTSHEAYTPDIAVSLYKVWVSDIDYNVYEPGVAGWSEIE